MVVHQECSRKAAAASLSTLLSVILGTFKFELGDSSMVARLCHPLVVIEGIVYYPELT